MYKKYIIAMVVIGFLGAMIIGHNNGEDAPQLQERGENLIRFHVLANSDAPQDQLLKLKVRDKIIKTMEKDFAASTGIEESRKIIRDNLKEIETVAREEIFDNGKDYEVSAVLEKDVFPTKRYGDTVFPAGRYEALKVVIGEGTGENWWCVMFPPLCFVDVKNGLTDERTQQELKAVLTEEEYRLVYTSANDGELPLQLKSKIVEVFQASRDQISRLASIF